MEFIDITDNPKAFLDILPYDWTYQLKIEFKALKGAFRVFVLSDDKIVLTGGVVFMKAPSDMEYAIHESNEWFQKGYRYLGYIWTNTEFRGMGYGLYWLDCLQGYFPGQKYWLTIEDYSLINFYKNKGFILQKEMSNQDTTEWLLAQT